MMLDKEGIKKIKETVIKEKKIAKELISILNYFGKTEDEKEKMMTKNHAERLKVSLRKINDELLNKLEELIIKRSLEGTAPKEIKVKKAKAEEEIPSPKKKIMVKEEKKTIPPKKKISWFKRILGKIFGKKKKIPVEKKEMSELDKKILKRLKKKSKKKEKKKEKKKNAYGKVANNFFSGFVRSLIKGKRFTVLERNLIKSNLGYTLINYISIMILTTISSLIISVLIFVFLLFFSISPELPIITRTTESLGIRFLKTFWITIIIPAGTLVFMYFYPYFERKSIEGRIDQELPFATIHMAAISGSMIEPTKIFSIIVSTEEYPHLGKEFNKLLNEINIYGYDLVSALKDMAMNSPSQKLGELFNGLATNITSGGDLYNYFDKKANSMLFEYRLNKEKRTKSAETFMDIYISVVIAAPMILMLLLMMMRISGFGVSLSTSLITLIIAGGVSVINIVFLVFSQIKQSSGAA